MAQPQQTISGRALADQLLAAARRSTQAAQDARDAAQRLAEGKMASEISGPALPPGTAALGG